MPTDNQGGYTLPNGTLVSTGETISPSQHNPPFEDVAEALTGRLSRDGKGGMRTHLDHGGFRAINMAPGVQPTDGATMAQIMSSGGVPAGSVMDFAGSSAPTGWLVCAGQTLSRADYPDLFAAIGTAYGAPSGATFSIPDCRGRVTAGRDVDSGGFAGRLTTPNAQTLGAAGGAQTVTLTSAQMPSHTHTVSGSTNSAGSHTHTVTYEGGSPVNVNSGFEYAQGVGLNGTVTDASGAHSHTISVSAENTGGGEAHSNVQPVIVLTKIIKVSNN